MIIRFFDIIISLVFLTILSPFLVIISLILSITAERKVFYVQQRIGKDGKNFRLLKFATMLKDSPHIGTGTVTVKNDPRILPFGKILRKTKFNELPQLINVLLGDMSLVGHRPQAPRNFAAYSEDFRRLLCIHKPGLTSLGSLVFRNEEELLTIEEVDQVYDTVIMPHKGELERYLLNNLNIMTYSKILALTVFVIIFGKDHWIRRSFPDLPHPPQKLKDLLLDKQG